MTKWVKNKDVKFTCQKDIWRYLVEDGAVKFKGAANIFCFEDGCLYPKGYNFSESSEWIPVKRAEWYEDIPEQGVLCWIDDINNTKRMVAIVLYFDGNYFTALNGSRWMYAKPLTKEETMQYLLPE